MQTFCSFADCQNLEENVKICTKSDTLGAGWQALLFRLSKGVVRHIWQRCNRSKLQLIAVYGDFARDTIQKQKVHYSGRGSGNNTKEGHLIERLY